ncbi:phosphate acyltransferase [Aliiroseovarius lamellibrachiae]|uniref:phosphate acyltransferase n=1 Tax=Aliiroseovarius lamellibrachiae TaxID=1924933 RepID=UPI001BDFD830|nr:phosphate acyltransferase [Aliiroseovarius lamellibrachiae]MBT2131356.1 phosphate acetyltransferase [Aliiroseovarius lamellibrachiae]
MTTLEKATEIAAMRPRRVVFPEYEDHRILQAADQLSRGGLAEPIALTPPSERQVEALLAQRPMKRTIAERILERPLMRAAAMLACGEADVMVAGANAPTRRVIEAASLAVGFADGIRAPSSFFLMQMPDGRSLVLADCAVHRDPNSDELAEIARMSAKSARLLLGRADVALLSFSTGSSGVGPSVDKVRTAAELTGFLGPIQADAALNPAIAAKKGASGAGVANTLIFPDLNSGNIAYKLLRELAGAQAIGPFLQGFKKPVCDLSRGATVEDIVAATVISIALAQAEEAER